MIKHPLRWNLRRLLIHRLRNLAWATGFTCFLATAPLVAAERHVLAEDNWDTLVPNGKEVDCIYGDVVLRNDRIVAIIAQPLPSRNANMTTKGIGGGVIDLTSRDPSNDQLTVLLPGGGFFKWREATDASSPVVPGDASTDVVYACTAEAEAQRPAAELTYRLRDGDAFLTVETRFHNPHAEAVQFVLQDNLRADKSFQYQVRPDARSFAAHDEWWRQSYVLIADDRVPVPVGDSLDKRRPVLEYQKDGSNQITLGPGESMVLRRRLFAAASALELQGLVDEADGREGHWMDLSVIDGRGPVGLARVEVTSMGQSLGSGRTSATGQVRLRVADGAYELSLTANGRPPLQHRLSVQGTATETVRLDLPGYVDGRITDAHGQSIPCKVEFRGVDGTADPYFGPDTFEESVQNLVYSAHGTFRQEIAPGRYHVLISHGPEYDAQTATIEVRAGEPTPLEFNLRRAVETPGWVSGDFHSHSTPSGDNTSSQRGRVLNLLAEHLEFAPCTEHNRISTYVPHLKELGCEHRMATCSGMELTGTPLPVNHQNAFPLGRKPRTQDGGGPSPDENPIVQIERLALWDQRAQKVVQGNHPHLMQILGDRDLDGRADGGFERMLGSMDIVEVHPPESILQFPTALEPAGERTNVIYHWMRLLNQGYRLPGVVNTDAHYNYHGSGFLRNYIKSPFDDPAQVLTADMLQAAERGQMVLTNGPYLEVRITSQVHGRERTAGPGDNLVAPQGNAQVHLRVQCANWLDINRVVLFINGRPSAEHDYRRSSHPHLFRASTVKFDQRLSLKLDRDAHVIAVAAGEGLQLGPVVGPDHMKDIPTAVANPIYLDVEADGFQPNGDTLDLPLPLN